MKILYLVEEHGDGGARWHRGLFGHLRQWGVEVEVLNLNRSPAFRRVMEELEVEIAELGASGAYWKTLPAVRRRLKRSSADLIHGIELIPTFYGAVARCLLLPPRRPLIYGRHHWDTRGRIHRLMDGWAFRASTRIFTVSEGTRAVALDEHPGAPEKKVVAIHNGIPLTAGKGDSRDAAVLRELSRSGGGFTVLLLARLRRQKGHDVALDAVAKLRSEGREVRLIFAGDGPLAGELREEIRKRELDGIVEMPGRIEDVGAVLELADVVVVPSRWEAFGLVAIEAMAAGRPVVASAVGGLREIVVDGETGVLVPPADVEALAAAVRSLMDDPERARRMGRAGRERYQERFTPEAMARAHVEEYRAVLGAGSAGEGDR